MAKKKVTRKKTRSTSGRKPSSAAARSKKTKKPATTAKKRTKTTKKPAKTAKKSAAKVVAKKPAKKPTKQTTKKTAKKAPTTTEKKPVTRSAAATSGTKKKVTTKAAAGSRKTTTKPRSRTAKRPSPDANGYVIINGRRVRMMAVAVTPVPVVTKRVRTRVKATAVPEPASKKTIKTKLGRKELNEYRTQLLIQRAELVGDLSAMEAQALRSGGGNPSHMPIHMADVGTDTFDQDFMLGMAETERRRLREIDAALKRIEDRTYGVCEMTGKAIPKARLAAKPWARFTIESALENERGQSE